MSLSQTQTTNVTVTADVHNKCNQIEHTSEVVCATEFRHAYDSAIRHQYDRHMSWRVKRCIIKNNNNNITLRIERFIHKRQVVPFFLPHGVVCFKALIFVY